MVTVFIQKGISISALMQQAQLVHRCYQRTIHEPYNGNRLPHHFDPQFIQKVERNVRHDGHQQLKIQQSVLQSFGQSKQLLRH
jgi:hypothetical protein